MNMKESDNTPRVQTNFAYCTIPIPREFWFTISIVIPILNSKNSAIPNTHTKSKISVPPLLYHMRSFNFLAESFVQEQKVKMWRIKTKLSGLQKCGHNATSVGSIKRVHWIRRRRQQKIDRFWLVMKWWKIAMHFCSQVTKLPVQHWLTQPGFWLRILTHRTNCRQRSIKMPTNSAAK